MSHLMLILFITTHWMHILEAFCVTAIIGTAGSTDLGTMSTSDALRQMVFYMLITLVSGCIVFASDKK